MFATAKYKELFSLDRPLIWMATKLDLAEHAAHALTISMDEFLKLGHSNLMRAVSRDDYAPPKTQSLNFYFTQPD